ncbi:MAG: histidine kinase [Bacteroidetes bacterium]|nr:histidine kinase [Bacteroidota bacterium]
MKKLFIHNTLFRICAPMLYGILVYLLILLVNNNLNDLLKIYSNKELYVCLALSYLSMESLRVTIILLANSLERIPRKYRVGIQTLISLSVSLLVVYLGVFSYFKWVEGYSVGWYELRLFFVIFGFTALLYNILYSSNEYLLRENTTQINLEAKLREKVEADFTAFKNDINPELLYESLESILQSLYVDVNDAEDQVDLLASIYRYQLMNRDKELVNLADELNALNNMISLFNFRHNGQLRLISKLESMFDAHVVPGSLLIAVDTIIRNTLLSRESAFSITLYEEDDGYIVMQHRLNDKLILHEESLLAFARIQRVYSFFSDVPFVQVKAYGENYIKFPAVKIAESAAVVS